MDTDKKTSRAHKKLRVLAGLITTLGSTGVIGQYWMTATNGFSNLDLSKPQGVTRVDSNEPAYLAERTADVKKRFVDMIASNAQQNFIFTLTPDERALAKNTLDQYNFMEEIRGKNGLYAAAFKKSDTGEVVITYGGTSSKNGIMPVINNIDDMFISTAGGEISQLKDALDFAKHIKKKYGKIDYVTGYSIGGYLALYLVGTGGCPGAECYVFDAPGVSQAMLNNCCEKSHSSRETVEQRFKDQCTSVTLSHNTYNTLGQQAGEYLTFSNDVCNWSIIPKGHLFPEQTANILHGTQMMHGDNSTSSNGPVVCTTALSTLAALGIALSLKKDKAIMPQVPVQIDTGPRTPNYGGVY